MNPSTDLGACHATAGNLVRTGLPELRPSMVKSDAVIPAIQRIMLLTDFTNASRQSYLCASNLARKFGATIYLVHLDRLRAPEHSSITNEQHLQDLRSALAAESQRADFIGVPVKCRLLSSTNIPKTLFSFEREVRSDWVVAATAAHAGLKRFIHSDSTERIVSFSTVPVLLFGSNANAGKFCHLKRVLVHFDFSRQATATLPIVQFLASTYRCAVNLAFPQPPEQTHWFGSSPHRNRTNSDVCEQRLNQMVTEELGGIDVETEICKSISVSEILRQANELDAGMIVVGTNGILSNGVRTLIREAPCPVLALPYRKSSICSDKQSNRSVK